MIKIVLFVLFPLGVFAQHIDYESMSDDQLQYALEKELLELESRGATPPLIFEKFIMETDEYIMSREADYRFVVHMNYVADKMLAMKMQCGGDAASHLEMVKKMKNQKTYQEYVFSSID